MEYPFNYPILYIHDEKDLVVHHLPATSVVTIDSLHQWQQTTIQNGASTWQIKVHPSIFTLQFFLVLLSPWIFFWQIFRPYSRELCSDIHSPLWQHLSHKGPCLTYDIGPDPILSKPNIDIVEWSCTPLNCGVLLTFQTHLGNVETVGKLFIILHFGHF